jgi:hypothetical protein
VLSVVRNIYDSTNNILPNITGAARIDYVTSVQLLRPASAINTNFKPIPSFTTTITQVHSPLITGTFTLSIGGVPIQVSGSPNIAYNVYPGDLQNAIASTLQGF